MDAFVFFALITFQITVLSIVAIVFGQNKIAEKAITGLVGVLKNFSLKRREKNTRKFSSKLKEKKPENNSEKAGVKLTKSPSTKSSGTTSPP